MHLKPFFAVFLALGLFLPFIQHNTFAQTSMEISLDEAVNLALEYNLSLKKNKIDLASSGYSEKRLWAEIFPAITASLGSRYETSFFDSSGSIFRNSAGINITVGLNAGIPYAMRSIKLAHQSNILKYEDARNQLSIQVTKKYYSLVAEKNNIVLLEEILNLAQRQYERNQTLFRNGIIRELVVIQSALALENARYNLSAANISYMNSTAEFLAMLGIEQSTGVILSTEADIKRIYADSQALISEYLPKRPDIVSSIQEIDRLIYAQKQLIWKNRAPSLSLSLDWGASKFDPFTDTLSASAQLRIPIDPLVPGTSGHQSIGRSKDAVEKARLDLEITENAAKTQIRSLAALLYNSWDSIVIARLGYDAAQRNYQLTEQAFNNGTVEYLILEDARNSMIDARQRLLQSELAYFNMILDLSAAINVDWNYLIQTYGVQSE